MRTHLSTRELKLELYDCVLNTPSELEDIGAELLDSGVLSYVINGILQDPEQIGSDVARLINEMILGRVNLLWDNGVKELPLGPEIDIQDCIICIQEATKKAEGTY